MNTKSGEIFRKRAWRKKKIGTIRVYLNPYIGRKMMEKPQDTMHALTT